MKKLTIYTDGGCHNNPGPGGWGFIILQNDEVIASASDFVADTTNNQMELMAPISALSSLDEPIVADIYTDSTYVKNGITLWIKKWKVNGWKSASGAVKNRQLWEKLDVLNQRNTISWHWVKAHSDNFYNNEVDKLVQNIIKTNTNNSQK